MSYVLRGATGLALAALVVAGLAPAVQADNLDVEGDILKDGSAVALGAVCRGASTSGGVSFDLVRNGNVNQNVWGNSAAVSISPGAQPVTTAGTLTLGSTAATTTSSWVSASNNVTVTSQPASVGLTVPAAAPTGAASATVTYTAIGSGASATSVDRTDSVTFSWTVMDCAPVDTTPPSVTYVLDPAEPNGLNGWYTTDVSIDWTVTDAESAVTITDGCEDTTFSTDGTFTPSCSATSAGGSAGPVSAAIKRDTVAPSVTFTGGPAAGSSYYFGDPVPGPSTCTATDEPSGVSAGGCTVTGGGSTVGNHVQAGSATDLAGNTGTAQRSYSVLAWTLDGFYRPVVTGEGVVNTVKAGSTVPLKFNVSKGTTPMTAGIGAKFTTARAGCDGGDAEDPIELVTTGGTSLRYDEVGKQWVQNWATPAGGKGSCYRVTMTTADGSSITADFKLK
jgi:hypothetical protein